MVSNFSAIFVCPEAPPYTAMRRALRHCVLRRANPSRPSLPYAALRSPALPAFFPAFPEAALKTAP